MIYLQRWSDPDLELWHFRASDASLISTFVLKTAAWQKGDVSAINGDEAKQTQTCGQSQSVDQFLFLSRLHRLCVNPDVQMCSDTARQMKTPLCKWIFNYIYNKNSSLAVTACFNSSGLNVDDNVLVWLQTRSASPVSVSLYWGSGRRNCLINLHHEAPSAHPPHRGI